MGVCRMDGGRAVRSMDPFPARTVLLLNFRLRGMRLFGHCGCHGILGAGCSGFGHDLPSLLFLFWGQFTLRRLGGFLGAFRLLQGSVLRLWEDRVPVLLRDRPVGHLAGDKAIGTEAVLG